MNQISKRECTVTSVSNKIKTECILRTYKKRNTKPNTFVPPIHLGFLRFCVQDKV